MPALPCCRRCLACKLGGADLCACLSLPACCCVQALLLGKPGSQCEAVPAARHWTFAELESQVGVGAGVGGCRTHSMPFIGRNRSTAQQSKQPSAGL